MIRVLIEVGSSRLRVMVQAESIRRAVAIVQARYPGAATRVVYPIDSESFFVKDPRASAGLAEIEMPESIAR